ncbi:hypothetical protein I7I50_03844 [Histoplasma capsulatum G186AR]|uniref:Uncharacterized protein n=1 Tax=Ajellomyces capsulatus TaxID=5037 RepID=A0A8H7YNY7_AJECA|nr:hypothetical protein I7I52_04752 [Histoplasma capsulatum]QSS74892.1 hypothetical protein I7I50_03844 [Histoplasma capsulatum G186AR]
MLYSSFLFSALHPDLLFFGREAVYISYILRDFFHFFHFFRFFFFVKTQKRQRCICLKKLFGSRCNVPYSGFSHLS